jgi:hypothetical protein
MVILRHRARQVAPGQRSCIVSRALNISHDVAVCPHVLQVPRSGQAPLGNERAFQPNRCSRVLISLFLMGSGTRRGPRALPHCPPPSHWEAGSGATERVVAPEPSEQGSGDRCHGAHGGPGALPRREARSRVTGHVAAPEPSHAGRRGLGPQDAWRSRSPPAQGGGIRSYRMHGNTRALPHREDGPSTVGYAAVCCCTPCFSP